MGDTNRRSTLIALAARYPELPRLAAEGATRDQLQAKVPVPLSVSDISLLASITDDEVRSSQQSIQKPFAETFPYGI